MKFDFVTKIFHLIMRIQKSTILMKILKQNIEIIFLLMIKLY